MERKGKTNAFFIEMILVILFFALSMAVVIQVFTAAHSRTVLSGDTSVALVKAQDVAEQFRALAEPEQPLCFLGNTSNQVAITFDSGWQKADGESTAYTLQALVTSKDTGAGTLLCCVITVTRADGVILSELTASRYMPAAT